MRRAYSGLVVFVMLVLLAWYALTPMNHSDSSGVTRTRLTMDVGQSKTLRFYENSETPSDVRYSIDGDVAELTPDGMLTAVAPGRAVITVTEGAQTKAVIALHVKAEDVTGDIRLSEAALVLNKGEVSALHATVQGEGAVTWSSSDPSIVSVDSAGRVVAQGVGTALIRATLPTGASASANVTVVVHASSVRIAQQQLLLGPGAHIALQTLFSPADATDTAGTWRSSDEGVVKVSEGGIIDAVAQGVAMVQYATQAGLIAQTEVTVDSYSAKLAPIAPEMTMERGEQSQLTLSLEPPGHYVQWLSSNPQVATVEDGVVTALQSGTANISVSADGAQYTCELTVQTTIQSIVLNMTELYLLRDQTAEPFPLIATVTPTDADDPTLTYTSDNALVARPSQDGMIHMTGAYGSATITVRAVGGAEATFRVHVVTELPESSPEDETA